MNLKKKIGKHIERRTVKNLKKEITKHISGKVILDNGCGIGSFLYEKHNEKRIYGIDKRKTENYEGIFKLADSTKLPFEDNFFDCVVFAGVIQYIRDYNKALKEIKRVLKNRGRLIISSVNRDSLLRRIKIIGKEPKREAGEFKIFSCRELEYLLKRYNFKIKEKLGVDYLPFPRNLCSNSLFICENEKSKISQLLNTRGVFSRNEK